MKFHGMLCLAFAVLLNAFACGQSSPPWSRGTNDPADGQGFVFHVADVDNMPDMHGNPCDARLVLLIGGNQFFVLPRLVDEFQKLHPEVKGHLFYETLPPGILRRQIEAEGTITLGNLTLQVKPDVYEAGFGAVRAMQRDGLLTDVLPYATNDLTLMVAKGNPKGIRSLADLGRPGLRLSMPNPAWEGVARQIQASLRKAGGSGLEKAVYEDKVRSGLTVLTEIHHRQTPMRIMSGAADAGVTWTSEVRFQESIGNPIEGVTIPESENTIAIYAGGIVRDAPHPAMAAAWLAFLKSSAAQSIYHRYGFRSVSEPARQGTHNEF
jgi:hypothetical protein